ncbi:hypothetical protein J5N97_021835 [Dioscorea zingiberensis]|uniref:DUF1771 domain-containing protein n=1 Tax=Dioscorea zingiberensis TaxID=325984 RepID=A0A9D5HAF1_9LILI|nr:hypothetical protein J5N97_021835 [Dioscorea zingiberensis]
MDQLTSSNFEDDGEMRVLNSLLEAFGSVCSLEEIADAYCKSKHDVNRTGEILYQLQTSKSSGEVHASTGGSDHVESKQSLHEYSPVESLESALPCKKSKEQSSKASASLGTVSSVIGHTYARATLSPTETSRTSKPLIVEMKGLINEDHESGHVASCITTLKESMSDKDVGEFLFSMLGDGFQLRTDVIQEIFGECGYNAKDSMEELSTLSEKALEKTQNFKHDITQNFTGLSSETESCISGQSYPSSSNERTSIEQSNLDKEKSSLSREILESLFHAPARSDEKPRKRLEWGLNRTRVVGQKVVSEPPEKLSPLPLVDISMFRPDVNDVLDEDDKFHLLRKATKQHWSTMKEYYVAAVDAFNKGDRAQVSYLIEQGRYYNQLAREANEKSQQEILETKNDQCDLPLDLHEHDPKEAVKLLKTHICSLARMPSFRYLKVMLNTGAEDTTKGKRRRMVIGFLEKKSIKWTEEEGNPGTILIKLDEIDPIN